MSTKSEKDAIQTTSFVESLQQAVQRSKKKEDLKTRVTEANTSLLGAAARKLTVTVRPEGTGEDTQPSIRVTCPSRTVASVEIPQPLAPELVEFYLTRPRADGVAETRLLGVAKYKDGDGKWNISFTSERFARKPDDQLVLHAEVFGEAGRRIAARAVAVVE